MLDDLGTEEVANGVDQITNDTITKEGKPHAMPGLQDHKLDQPPKQGAASFGAGQSTVEHVFNRRVIIAKHLEHQRNLYHNLIDFKAFDRVCHDGLWKVLIVGKTDWRLCESHPGSLRPSQQRVILNIQLGKFFRASRRQQIGVFTHSCSVQFLPWKNHTWDPQRTVHCHSSVLQMT